MKEDHAKGMSQGSNTMEKTATLHVQRMLHTQLCLPTPNNRRLANALSAAASTKLGVPRSRDAHVTRNNLALRLHVLVDVASWHAIQGTRFRVLWYLTSSIGV